MHYIKTELASITNEAFINNLKRKFLIRPLKGLSIYILSNNQNKNSFSECNNNSLINTKINYLTKIVKDNGGIIINSLESVNPDYIVIPEGVDIDLNDTNYSIIIDKLVTERWLLAINSNTNLQNSSNNYISKFINPLIDSDYCYKNINIHKQFKDIIVNYYDCNSDELPNLFINKLFYIDELITNNPSYKELVDLLKYCINIGKGIYIDRFIPLVSYVVTFNKNININSNSNNNNNCYVVENSIINPSYIMCCIKENKLLDPLNFQPLSSVDILKNKAYDNNQYSNNNDKNQFNKSSISNIYNNIHSKVSYLFKGLSFYILEDTYNKEITYLKELGKEILIHSGDIYSCSNNSDKIDTSYIISNIKHTISDIHLKRASNNNNTITDSLNYIIINDGYSDLVSFLIQEKQKNKNFSYIVISHRFISFCIEKNKVYDLKVEKFYHVFPLVHSVPFDSFNNINILFKKFNNQELRNLEYLAIAIGASSGFSDINKTTHIILSDEVNESVIQDYKSKLNKCKDGNKIKLVSIRWLTESLFYGRKLDEKEFQF